MMGLYSPLLFKEFIITYKDHPGVQSIVLHTDVDKCQLNCYKCHNKHSYFDRKYFTYDILDKKLDLAKIMGTELIIISGGEPTIIELDKLIEVLEFIKNKSFPIRLDTNGLSPDILRKLIERNLIDGVAIDIKIPIQKDTTDTKDDIRRYKVILFYTTDVPDSTIEYYRDCVDESINIAESGNLKYNLYRTVRYPLLLDSDIEYINKYVTDKNIKDKHKWLDFFEPPK